MREESAKNFLQTAFYRAYIALVRQVLNRREQVYQYEPYDVCVYDELLTYLLSRNRYHFIRMCDYPASVNDRRINVLLRHDLDSEECLRNLQVLVETEKKHGVCSSMYLRVDRDKYDPFEWRSVVEEYRSMGFEVGLHSVCYTREDFLDRFRWEVEQFEINFGFRPASFTQHGMGQKHVALRRQFNSSVSLAKELTGIKTTDCAGYDIRYLYRITDANWCPNSHSRFITDYFISPPLVPFACGKVLLVLTHPCYWTR